MGRSQLYVRTLGLEECGHLERYDIDNKKEEGKYKHRLIYSIIHLFVYSKISSASWVPDLVLGIGNMVVGA